MSRPEVVRKPWRLPVAEGLSWQGWSDEQIQDAARWTALEEDLGADPFPVDTEPLDGFGFQRVSRD